MFRATVVSISENGVLAKILMENGRTEFVRKFGFQKPFRVGQHGFAKYSQTVSGYEWSFDVIETKGETK
jgi:hypothetical protein